MSNPRSIEISVNTRDSGKHFSRSLRVERKIPAVVYGPKIQNANVYIAENDALKYSKHGYENVIFTLKSDDKTINQLKVLKKAITFHPVSRKPIHLDFFAPDMSQKVRVNVEVKFTGKALGMSEGGVLTINRRDVEVECLPTEIPEFIAIDVSDLNLNEGFHVSDLKAPEGIKILTGGQESLVIITRPEEEVVATPAAAVPGAEGAAAPGAAGAAAPGAAAPAAGAAAPAAAPKKDEKK